MLQIGLLSSIILPCIIIYTREITAQRDEKLSHVKHQLEIVKSLL